MKLRLAALCKWMYHIKRALKYLRSMVGNKARVEGCITESFLLKEIIYFLSVYFAEEHNVNVVALRYNVNEEPPLSDLKKSMERHNCKQQHDLLLYSRRTNVCFALHV
jgi:hypothetical protein